MTRTRLGVVALMTGVMMGLMAVPASSVAVPDPVPPTANAKGDYQIGKPYDPRDGVTVFSCDRTVAPLAEAYTICYVNAYQTQPGTVRWWKSNHPELLLKKSDGGHVFDSYCGEILFDGVSGRADRMTVSPTCPAPAVIHGQARIPGVKSARPQALPSCSPVEGQPPASQADSASSILVTRSNHRDVATLRRSPQSRRDADRVPQVAVRADHPLGAALVGITASMDWRGRGRADHVMRTRLGVLGLIIGAVTGMVVVPASSVTVPDPVLPTANAKWDYQIGKPYDPRDGVTVVSRDRTIGPLAEAYTMCYVNAFQTQPDAVRWWKNNHPELLLKKADGSYVVDSYWGEILFDIRTPKKREALAAIVNGWITGCANDGFQAVEPDNLDSWTRSGRLTRDQAFAFAALIIEHAHAEGLAIGQKNAAGQTSLGKAAGFDFAVVEECGRYRECNAYTAAYGDQVYVIEYRSQDFSYSCERWGDRLAIILRDRNVTAPGSKNYVYRSC